MQHPLVDIIDEAWSDEAYENGDWYWDELVRAQLQRCKENVERNPNTVK